jgi:hypothetical protein
MIQSNPPILHLAAELIIAVSPRLGSSGNAPAVRQKPRTQRRIRAMGTPTPKELAHALLDELPDTATWAELAYRLEVRADIEEGLADVKAGRVVSTEELRREFDLSE